VPHGAPGLCHAQVNSTNNEKTIISPPSFQSNMSDPGTAMKIN
jgi:hypothetical protein